VIALVDESIGVSGEGCYIVAMVVVPTEKRDVVRRRVRRVMPSPNQRFHFHRETPATKFGMLGLLGEVSTRTIAYRVTPVGTRRQAQARAQCLKALALDLDGVTELLIESRESNNDAVDRRLIAHAVRRGDVTPTMDYGHRRPADEPLLWLADALAGAVLADSRRRRRFLQALPEGCLTIRANP
jgi:hypothetical protein